MSDPRILDFRAQPWADALERAVLEHARAGGLIAMPTETVYGFGCIAETAAVQELLALKGRTAEKPFLVLIPDMGGARDLRWTSVAKELAEVFWPGALTLILEDPEKSFPPGVRSPAGGVAVRVSPNPIAGWLVSALSVPMVSTSANLSGAPSALTALEAAKVGKAMGAGADLWVLDGGNLATSQPSTIVDCTGPTPLVVRAGAVPINRLRCVVPTIDEFA